MPSTSDQGEISIEIDGEVHSGTYVVEKGMVTVLYRLGRKSTQLGGSPAKSLARIMLREMVTESKE